MATRLIEMDGVLIEAEVSESEAEPISSKFAEKVENSFDQINAILTKICKPLKNSWVELNKDMTISGAEVEIKLGIEGGGNIYIVNTKSSCSLSVKLILNPQIKRN